MQADAAALPQTAMLQRQEFLTAYPRFGKLNQKANAIREEIKQNPLLPAAAKPNKQRDKLFSESLKIASEQEKILRQMVVRREPVEMVFPPLRESKDVQSSMSNGEAILMLHVASQAHYGFLVTKGKSLRIETEIVKSEKLEGDFEKIF